MARPATGSKPRTKPSTRGPCRSLRELPLVLLVLGASTPRSLIHSDEEIDHRLPVVAPAALQDTLRDLLPSPQAVIRGVRVGVPRASARASGDRLLGQHAIGRDTGGCGVPILWPARQLTVAYREANCSRPRRRSLQRAILYRAADPVGCLYSIGGAGGECPSREKPLETDACVQSTGPQQSRQRSTAGERKTAAFQSPIEFWHPTRLGRASSAGAAARLWRAHPRPQGSAGRGGRRGAQARLPLLAAAE